MTGMEDVLAMIEDLVFEGTGHHLLRDGRDGSFTPTAALLADMLSNAGFGNLHDAWEDGAEALTDHWANEQYSPHSNGSSDPPANPYPAPKVIET